MNTNDMNKSGQWKLDLPPEAAAQWKLVFPPEVWREILWQRAMAIMAELTDAGSSPVATAVAMTKIDAFNAVARATV